MTQTLELCLNRAVGLFTILSWS